MACGDTTAAVMYGKPSIIVERYWAFWGFEYQDYGNAICKL
jgi:hypothetical protein